ncbi:MAG: hypothetical protein CW338_11050 [Clostridiales bacterium]|nr:hypothetical protein [Clostridiales bacterium]
MAETAGTCTCIYAEPCYDVAVKARRRGAENVPPRRFFICPFFSFPAGTSRTDALTHDVPNDIRITVSGYFREAGENGRITPKGDDSDPL